MTDRPSRAAEVGDIPAVPDEQGPRRERSFGALLVLFAMPGVLAGGLRPRLMLLTGPWAERLAGAACLVLSFMVFLPIPFANLLPAAGILLFGGVVLGGLVASAHVLRS